MRSRYLFIDRDGVINKDPAGWTEHSYVTNLGQFQFLPGALEALQKLNRAGYKVVVISNQAGVGKGHFSKARLDEINTRMRERVKEAGGDIVESFYCTHRREDNCGCRKPKTGLLEMASKKYRIVPHETYFIGDSEVDMRAGAAVGAATVFVRSGKMTEDELKKAGIKPDYVFKDLREAADWIVTKEERKEKRAYRREHEPRKRRYE